MKKLPLSSDGEQYVNKMLSLSYQSSIYVPTGTLRIFSCHQYSVSNTNGLTPISILTVRISSCFSGSTTVAVYCLIKEDCSYRRLKSTLPSGYTRSMTFSTVVSWMKDLLECTKNTSGTQIFFISLPSKVILLFLVLRNESLSSFQ